MSKAECRKFSPNIFNKQKCASCFKHKEEHSAAALDSNRASRKVQRCGFLFVAPDWDFSNPLNRTKRWQRRWFVLYDDGELTYSVDDHPETVPHGVIDMSKVLEVADAEDVTGNSYSVALTAPDRVTFIKGTCRDESRWWMDALDVYTTAMVKGRNKRNATFPGGRASTHSSATTREASGAEPFQTPPVSRRRLMSCQSEPVARPPAQPPPRESRPSVQPAAKENRPPASEPLPVPGAAQPANDADPLPASSESPPTQDRCRTRRLAKLARQTRQGRAKSADTIAEILSTGRSSQNFLNEEEQPQRITDSLDSTDSSGSARLTSTSKQEDGGDLADYSSRREEKLKDIADSLTRPRPTRTLSFLQSIEHSKLQSADEKPTRENDDDSSVGRSATPPSDVVIGTDRPDAGDAVVGGGDTTELRVNLPAEELLRIKKGWLMKLTEKKTWAKHWFVLRGTSLILYRDTGAEDLNVTDGLIDLNGAQWVEECETEKNYGFQITTWDGTRIQLSAMTSGIRGNWIQALRSAAHLSDSDHRLSLGERLERQLDTARRPLYTTAERDTAMVAPSSGRQAAPQSTDSCRSASESSDGSGGERADKISDSPPESLGSLTRTKDRVRSRSSSSSRSTKRSRSSPDGSRSSTLDQFPTPEELGSPVETPTESADQEAMQGVNVEGEQQQGQQQGQLQEQLAGQLQQECEEKESQQRVPLSQRQHEPLQRQHAPLQRTDNRQQQQQTQRLGTTEQEDQPKQQEEEHQQQEQQQGNLQQRQEEQQKQQQPKQSTVAEVSPFRRSWGLGRESLRSSLRSDNLYSGRLEDTREPFTAGLDRSKLRSSLRTLPTEPSTGGHDPVLSRLRQRIAVLEADRSEAERQARRAVAEQAGHATELAEWRGRASSLEHQLTQLLQRLQHQERQLAEQTEQVQQLQQVERRYHQLLRQYDELQASRTAVEDGEQWRRHYERLEERYLSDHADWERQLNEAEQRLHELRQKSDAHAETDRSVHQLTAQLRQAETQLRQLTDQLEASRQGRQQEVAGLRQEATVRETEMRRLKAELEAQQSTRDAIKQDKSEVYKLKDLVHELRSLLEDRASELERQRKEAKAARQELTEARQELAEVRQEMESVQARLQQGIEENETLSARVRALSGQRGLSRAGSTSLGTSRERMSSRRQLQIASIASLSDLTAGVTTDTDNLGRDQLQDEYSALLDRFDKAVAEIRALKRQLRELQGQQDQTELETARLKQQLENRNEAQAAEAALMKDRLQDLTAKLATSEKQARQLKQKLAKGDARDRRRTSSLKGRESFSIPAELETKLSELEKRVAAWDGKTTTETTPSTGSASQASNTSDQATPSVRSSQPDAAAATGSGTGEPARARRSRSFEESTKAWRLRRKSLDSATASDSLKVIMRVNSLEQRVAARNTKSPSPPRRSPAPVRKVSPAPVRKVRARSAELRPASPDRPTGELRTRLRKLESLVRQVREQLETCVGELQATEIPEISSVCGRLSDTVSLLSGARLQPSDGIRAVVERVRQLLLRKAHEQAQAQAQLKAARRWTAAERRRLSAERLAYQTVVLACLAEALQAAGRPAPFERRLRLQLLLETHRRVGTLRHRLTTGEGVENVSSGMVEAFSSLLAEHLGSLEESAALLRPTGAGTGAGAGGSSAPTRRTPAVQQDRQLRRLHHSLLKQESEVTAAVTAFKTDKLSRLAESLAAETLLGGQQPPADDDQLLEEEKVRDAWNMAQNTITEEMVEAEMSTMMLKFVELYERDLEVDRQHCFLLVQAQQQLAERRYTVATDSLRAEMEEAVMALSQRYETALARLRAAPEPPPPPPADQSDRLLAELADVVAQKAIVDGYLSVISDEDESGSDATLEIIEEDPAGDRAVPLDTSLQRDSALAVFFGEGASASDQAELQHLYRAAVERCRGELSDYGVAIPAGQTLDEFCERTQETVAAVRAECTAQLQQERNRHKEQVRSLERELDSLRKSRLRPRSVDKSRRRVSDITGMVASAELETAPLGVIRQELTQGTSTASVPASAEEPCRQCEELRARTETLSSEHTSELKALRKVQDAELEQLRREMTSEVNKVTATYEREKEALASEVRLLRRRLESLETEYETQLSSLRGQYERTAGEGAEKPHDDALAEESIRRRYQAEIEQLRALCEKGLVAMENSHRRIIADLEEKHHRELRALEAEKQQALAEETQATLAALDALRKAHETEVQREICKFKDEFIKKMQPTLDVGKLQKEHVAEMGDIKGEILSLSEKYSIKCLETASLEEKVETQTRSLQEANQRVFQLDARNKQLRAQLSANISELSEGNSAAGKSSAGQQLALARSQLTETREEAQRLQHQLESTQKREAELTALCGQLCSYLRAERQLRTDEVSSLRARLEHVVLTASRCQQGSRVGAHGSGGSSDAEEQPPRLRRGASLNPARIRELMRSPSCPRLTGSVLSAAALGGRLSSPLSGMVASRKKVFETPTPDSGRQTQRI
ncbi:protein outspread-like [Amphibalanus amphitrite]|uniref:protein outspread-like n=1 Tax=Amphibalanus amphitrite TaxID=1232801 RepID=UPI001C90D8D9|nr:protein outspread-like [Amphibalanus amphitrite]